MASMAGTLVAALTLIWVLDRPFNDRGAQIHPTRMEAALAVMTHQGNGPLPLPCDDTCAPRWLPAARAEGPRSVGSLPPDPSGRFSAGWSQLRGGRVMSFAEFRTCQVQLLELTVRLTEEFPDLPAGSVMRCVARVVRSERRHGVPDDVLPARAEARVRGMLRRRTAVDRAVLLGS